MPHLLAYWSLPLATALVAGNELSCTLSVKRGAFKCI